MVKVSDAFPAQIMIRYHHCAVPDPLRAVSGPHTLRDGINRDSPGAFSEVEASLESCEKS